jgi:hypothetical protein
MAKISPVMKIAPTMKSADPVVIKLMRISFSLIERFRQVRNLITSTSLPNAYIKIINIVRIATRNIIDLAKEFVKLWLMGEIEANSSILLPMSGSALQVWK